MTMELAHRDALERDVRRRIAALFENHDPRARADAEAELRAFSKSDQAWVIVLHILESADARAIEAFFCARTLHELLRRCVHKEEKTQASHAAFTESEWVQLRERLLTLTKRFAQIACSGDSSAVDAKSTVTMLTLSLSALGCKMPTWKADNVVRDIIEAFTSDTSVPDAAKLLCLCSFLAVVPQEATSRDLSIHPMRREEVISGLKSTGGDVMNLLQQLANATAGDASLQKHIMDALEAWADIADVTRAFPRVIVEGALHVTCSEDCSSSMKQSAAGAARASLEQCVWTTDRSLREMLASAMTMLRGEVVGSDKSEETRVLIADILSCVASKALRDQKDSTKNPLATGPNASGDRTYHKYAEFKRLQREQKKNGSVAQQGRQKTSIAVDIDREVLMFALDGLSDALSMGVSISSALEPWGKLAKSFMSDEFVESLRPIAARCVHAAVAYVRSVPRHELQDDQKKDEISECLRDVVSVVAIVDILDDFNARFSSEMHAADWRMINARLYVLLALAKSFKSIQAGSQQLSFANLINNLCALLSHGAAVPRTVMESTCWVLAGMASSMATNLAESSLLHVAHTLVQCMRCPEHTVARGAAVALMRLSEQSTATKTLSSTDVPTMLAEIHRSGGPTPSPSTSLELGQERESTILLRCLTFYTACDTQEATENACSMLAEPVVGALNSCLSDASKSSDEYVQRLVDLDIVLRAIKRAYGHMNNALSTSMARLVVGAVDAVERTTLILIDPQMIEQRFKIGWVMKALVELSNNVEGLLETTLRLCVEAYSRSPSTLGACYLDALTLVLELYGDRGCAIVIHGDQARFASVGHVICELLASALPTSLQDPDAWISLYALARAAVRSGCIALIPHVQTMMRVCKESLHSVSDESAVAALLLATDLLRSPVMLDAHASTSVNLEKSRNAMNSGMGRVAAEVSGESTRKRGVCAWNSGAQSQLLVAAIMAEIESGAGATLVRAILEGGNGALAPSMISDIAAALHLVWNTFGTERFTDMLVRALGDEQDAFPRKKATQEEKLAWVSFLLSDTCSSDCRVFKRMLKAFLSGKKAGSN